MSDPKKPAEDAPIVHSDPADVTVDPSQGEEVYDEVEDEDEDEVDDDDFSDEEDDD